MAKKKDGDKSAQSGENNKATKTEANEDEEPTFSDPEDYIEDIPDEGDFLKIPYLNNGLGWIAF